MAAVRLKIANQNGKQRNEATAENNIGKRRQAFLLLAVEWQLRIQVASFIFLDHVDLLVKVMLVTKADKVLRRRQR